MFKCSYTYDLHLFQDEVKYAELLLEYSESPKEDPVFESKGIKFSIVHENDSPTNLNGE